jgi:hypothetical protein
MRSWRWVAVRGILLRHPVRVSQLLLHVGVCRGLLFLAPGSVLTDLLMDFHQATVKVQGGLPRTFLTDLGRCPLSFLSLFDRALQRGFRFPELVRTHAEVVRNFHCRNLVVDQAELYDGSRASPPARRDLAGGCLKSLSDFLHSAGHRVPPVSSSFVRQFGCLTAQLLGHGRGLGQ